jgi:LPS-assembly protein
VAVNIGDLKIQSFYKMIFPRYGAVALLSATAVATGIYHTLSFAKEVVIEPVQACVIAHDSRLTPLLRSQFAQCLGWQSTPESPLCEGSYKPITIASLNGDAVQIEANDVSFYGKGRSELRGNVSVQQAGRIVNAQTAYVYRDAKTNKVTQIELLGDVHYLEAGRLMIARKATINPQDKSGKVEDVLYRFNYQKHGAILPSWGRASHIERFANKDYLLEKATYSTCAPEDDAWHIEADKITLNSQDELGVARNARLMIKNKTILYTPYLSFPTSKKRKSGFLMPVVGSSNVGGFDLALPYYWNIAPNYDATITPHLYTKRGLMLGGQFRYLTSSSFGFVDGRFLPDDRAYKSFLQDKSLLYPEIGNKSTNRWSFQLQNSTLINPDLHFGLNLEQVSDDNFLQDFSTNLAVMTERQLLRQGDLSYTTDHWFFRGMVQSYQTLHPIDETPIEDAYQRLPQLKAFGKYDELPFNGSFSLLGQFDYFQWPGEIQRPDGSRYHLNPVLSLPQRKPWGFFTPSIELVENYYGVTHQTFVNPLLNQNLQYTRTIPRYSVDSGLYFERPVSYLSRAYTQTLEPRLFYLYVPYHDQTPIPVFDSGYMIFNYDQLFRNNRFSGFDRIGDTNQLSYALSTRWLAEDSGIEKASLTLGQSRYFSNRRVQLCQNVNGDCVDSPLILGSLSPDSTYSPVVTRGVYRFNPSWVTTGDYVWDPETKSTNNGHVNFHYQPQLNKIISLGYTYLVNGDITQAGYTLQTNPLHQATFAYAWPFSTKWSTVGAYNYNISKQYEMMSLFGVQYDSCCFAMRLVGGRTFRDLNTLARPRYNNNVYFQILLKGLGSAGNSDPSSRLRTFIQGYNDIFRN